MTSFTDVVEIYTGDPHQKVTWDRLLELHVRTHSRHIFGTCNIDRDDLSCTDCPALRTICPNSGNIDWEEVKNRSALALLGKI